MVSPRFIEGHILNRSALIDHEDYHGDGASGSAGAAINVSEGLAVSI